MWPTGIAANQPLAYIERLPELAIKLLGNLDSLI